MERHGRLNIMIGVDPRYCAECGSPELEDGCSNSGCWRARPNARLPISLVIEQMAIRKSFPSGRRAEGFMRRCLQSLKRPLLSHGIFFLRHAEKHA